MSLQKNEDSGKINFLNKIIEIKEEKIAEQKVNKQELKTPQKSDNSSAIESKGSPILSAGQGTISNIGGSSKYVKSETSNSIWDSNKLESLAKKEDSGERIKKENKQATLKRENIEKERLDEMVDSLQETDMRRANNVSGIGGFKGSKFNMPENNISIFDDKEFERVPEKTNGEKLAEIERNKKDDSWKDIRKPTTTKDFFNKMFDEASSEKGTS